jgi:hypothetical protein
MVGVFFLLAETVTLLRGFRPISAPVIGKCRTSNRIKLECTVNCIIKDNASSAPLEFDYRELLRPSSTRTPHIPQELQPYLIIMNFKVLARSLANHMALQTLYVIAISKSLILSISLAASIIWEANFTKSFLISSLEVLGV